MTKILKFGLVVANNYKLHVVVNGVVTFWLISIGVNKSTRIENESGKINPNKANTFPKRNTKDLLMVLVYA
jgi:hypothetical protein